MSIPVLTILPGTVRQDPAQFLMNLEDSLPHHADIVIWPSDVRRNAVRDLLTLIVRQFGHAERHGNSRIVDCIFERNQAYAATHRLHYLAALPYEEHGMADLRSASSPDYARGEM